MVGVTPRTEEIAIIQLVNGFLYAFSLDFTEKIQNLLLDFLIRHM